MANLEGRLRRLKLELEKINKFCEDHNNISYRVEKNVFGTSIPEIYEFTFNLETFIGINPDNSPIIGHIHKIQIDLSNNYPTFPCKIKAVSDIWHPNIKFFQPGKGHVCSNSEAIGNETMFNLLMRLEDILTYKNYLAKNEFPWPDDLEVAQWVREYGEPKGYIEKLLAKNSGSVTQQVNGDIDERKLIKDFIYNKLDLSKGPKMVESEDIETLNLFAGFIKAYSDLESDIEEAEIKSLIENEIENLKENGKLIVLF